MSVQMLVHDSHKPSCSPSYRCCTDSYNMMGY